MVLGSFARAAERETRAGFEAGRGAVPGGSGAGARRVVPGAERGGGPGGAGGPVTGEVTVRVVSYFTRLHGDPAASG
ncbi:hypothetical protein GCM10018952_46300 [Streptosporangium vulgare]